MGEIYAVGHLAPQWVEEGFLMVTGNPPILIIMGVASPTREETRAISQGRIRHGFGSNMHTSYLTLQVFDVDNSEKFTGEVFYTAAKEDGVFCDTRMRELWRILKPGIGLTCTLVLVDTSTQIVMALRHYSWSHVLSCSFLAAAEITRNSTPVLGDLAADRLQEILRPSELAKLANIRFELAPRADVGTKKVDDRPSYPSDKQEKNL